MPVVYDDDFFFMLMLLYSNCVPAVNLLYQLLHRYHQEKIKGNRKSNLWQRLVVRLLWKAAA